MERFGERFGEGEVEDGGLKIYTTLEPALQQAAEQSLARQLSVIEKLPGYEHQTWALYQNLVQRGLAVEPEYVQGAVIMLENATGAIRAVGGGRDISHSTYNRALLSRRQVGSTFKPLVYAAAVDHAGLFPGSLVNDAQIRPGEIVTAGGISVRRIPMAASRAFNRRGGAWQNPATPWPCASVKWPALIR